MPSFRRRSLKRSLSKLVFECNQDNAVLKLIQAEAWAAVRALFDSERYRDLVEVIRTPLSQGDELHMKDTILHSCCAAHPPIDIIMLVYAAFPEAAGYVDKLERTPLHVACKNGASPVVIQFLLEKNTAAASAQDLAGMTPLHLACEKYLFTYRPIEGFPKPPNNKEAIDAVVTHLIAVAPESITMEDKTDMCALEYAIESGCPLRIVKKLQKTSEKYLKARAAGEMSDSSSHSSAATTPTPLLEPRGKRRASISMAA